MNNYRIVKEKRLKRVEKMNNIETECQDETMNMGWKHVKITNVFTYMFIYVPMDNA